jgi:asparagine synthase (glutamine-hydrolysing)
LLSNWKTPQDIVPGGVEPETLFDRIGRNGAFPDRDRCMLYLDALTYLPDDILVKVDRAAMAVSLETRIPLLDHRVVELVWSLPNRFRWQPGFSKWALRQILYRYVPQAIMDRPKQGFGVPVGQWIRGAMHDWADARLNAEHIAQQNLFAPQLVQQAWQGHQSGEYEHQALLWAVLMAEGILAA